MIMRIIGPHRGRSDIELDPVAAYRRGRILDAMLRSALPKPKRGVYRGTFEAFRRMDEARMVEAARRLNEG
jgi:hypothetical protein